MHQSCAELFFRIVYTLNKAVYIKLIQNKVVRSISMLSSKIEFGEAGEQGHIFQRTREERPNFEGNRETKTI